MSLYILGRPQDTYIHTYIHAIKNTLKSFPMVGEEMKFGIGTKGNKEGVRCAKTSDSSGHEMKNMMNSALCL